MASAIHENTPQDSIPHPLHPVTQSEIEQGVAILKESGRLTDESRIHAFAGPEQDLLHDEILPCRDVQRVQQPICPREGAPVERLGGVNRMVGHLHLGYDPGRADRCGLSRES